MRLGGDEFCILAPESGPAEGERLAARVRWAVAGAVEGLEALSVSAGWAVWPDDGAKPEELLQPRRRGSDRREAAAPREPGSSEKRAA